MCGMSSSVIRRLAAAGKRNIIVLKWIGSGTIGAHLCRRSITSSRSMPFIQAKQRNLTAVAPSEIWGLIIHFATCNKDDLEARNTLYSLCLTCTGIYSDALDALWSRSQHSLIPLLHVCFESDIWIKGERTKVKTNRQCSWVRMLSTTQNRHLTDVTTFQSTQELMTDESGNGWCVTYWVEVLWDLKQIEGRIWPVNPQKTSESAISGTHNESHTSRLDLCHHGLRIPKPTNQH